MNYKSISLTTAAGISLALCNNFKNVYEVYDAVEDAENAEDLKSKLEKTKNYIKEFIIDKDKENKIRFKLICNMCNNIHYLTIYKD